MASNNPSVTVEINSKVNDVEQIKELQDKIKALEANLKAAGTVGHDSMESLVSALNQALEGSNHAGISIKSNMIDTLAQLDHQPALDNLIAKLHELNEISPSAEISTLANKLSELGSDQQALTQLSALRMEIDNLTKNADIANKSLDIAVKANIDTSGAKVAIAELNGLIATHQQTIDGLTSKLKMTGSSYADIANKQAELNASFDKAVNSASNIDLLVESTDELKTSLKNVANNLENIDTNKPFDQKSINNFKGSLDEIDKASKQDSDSFAKSAVKAALLGVALAAVAVKAKDITESVRGIKSQFDTLTSTMSKVKSLVGFSAIAASAESLVKGINDAKKSTEEYVTQFNRVDDLKAKVSGVTQAITHNVEKMHDATEKTTDLDSATKGFARSFDELVNSSKKFTFDNIGKYKEEIDAASTASKGLGNILSGIQSDSLYQQAKGAMQLKSALNDVGVSTSSIIDVARYALDGKKNIDELNEVTSKFGVDLYELAGVPFLSNMKNETDEATRSISDMGDATIDVGGMLLTSFRDGAEGAKELGNEIIESPASALGELADKINTADTMISHLSGNSGKAFAGTSAAADIALNKFTSLGVVVEDLYKSYNEFTKIKSTEELVNSAIDLNQQWAKLKIRIDSVTSSEEESATVRSRLLKISSDTNTSIEDNIGLFTKLKTVTENTGLSTEQLLKISETWNKSLKLSGATTAEATGATQQFSQSLGGLFLQAEEYNSIVDANGKLINELAKNTYGAEASVNEFSRAVRLGMITSEDFTKGLIAAAPAIDAAYSGSAQTIEGAQTRVHNAFLQWAGDMDVLTSLSSNVAESLNFVADNFDVVINTLLAIGGVKAASQLLLVSGAAKGLYSALTEATLSGGSLISWGSKLPVWAAAASASFLIAYNGTLKLSESFYQLKVAGNEIVRMMEEAKLGATFLYDALANPQDISGKFVQFKHELDKLNGTIDESNQHIKTNEGTIDTWGNRVNEVLSGLFQIAEKPYSLDNISSAIDDTAFRLYALTDQYKQNNETYKTLIDQINAAKGFDKLAEQVKSAGENAHYTQGQLEAMALSMQGKVKAELESMRVKTIDVTQALQDLGLQANAFGVTAFTEAEQAALRSLDTLLKSSETTADTMSRAFVSAFGQITSTALPPFTAQLDQAFVAGKLKANDYAILLADIAAKHGTATTALDAYKTKMQQVTDPMVLAQYQIGLGQVAGTINSIAMNANGFGMVLSNAFTNGKISLDLYSAGLQAMSGFNADTGKGSEALRSIITELWAEGAISADTYKQLLEEIKGLTDKNAESSSLLEQAMSSLGVKSSESLANAAIEAKNAYLAVKNLGGSVYDVKESFLAYAKAQIEADKATGQNTSSALRQQAALLGVSSEFDALIGKAEKASDSIKRQSDSADDSTKKNNDLADSLRNAADGYDDMADSADNAANSGNRGSRDSGGSGGSGSSGNSSSSPMFDSDSWSVITKYYNVGDAQRAAATAFNNYYGYSAPIGVEKTEYAFARMMIQELNRYEPKRRPVLMHVSSSGKFIDDDDGSGSGSGSGSGGGVSYYPNPPPNPTPPPNPPTPTVVKYKLTVTNGDGSGEYEAGQAVKIKAADKGTYHPFVKWLSNQVYFQDSNAKETSIIMPKMDVTVEATYIDKTPQPHNPNTNAPDPDADRNDSVNIPNSRSSSARNRSTSNSNAAQTSNSSTQQPYMRLDLNINNNRSTVFGSSDDINRLITAFQNASEVSR